MSKKLIRSYLSKVHEDTALQNKLEAENIDTRWFIVMATYADFVITEDKGFNDRIKTEADIASELERIENKLKSVISCHQASK